MVDPIVDVLVCPAVVVDDPVDVLVVGAGLQQQVSADGPPTQYVSPPVSCTSLFCMHLFGFCLQVP